MIIDRIARCTLSVCLLTAVGCSSPVSVSARTKFGPEFIDRTGANDDVRYYAQQGLVTKFDDGSSFAVDYRYRWFDDSNTEENAVFLTVSFPIWKKGGRDDVTARLGK